MLQVWSCFSSSLFLVIQIIHHVRKFEPEVSCTLPNFIHEAFLEFIFEHCRITASPFILPQQKWATLTCQCELLLHHWKYLWLELIQKRCSAPNINVLLWESEDVFLLVCQTWSHCGVNRGLSITEHIGIILNLEFPCSFLPHAEIPCVATIFGWKTVSTAVRGCNW